MQIEIYNMIPADDKLSITLEAVCDSFSSLLWDIEYYACGVLKCTLPHLRKILKSSGQAELWGVMMIKNTTD